MKLYDHQKIALSYMKYNKGFALFMDMGTGKTLTALVHVSNLLSEGKINKTLVITPKAVLESWKKEIQTVNEHFDGELNDENIFITNYAQLNSKNYKKIKKEKWDCIILDESHYIKNRKAKRTKKAWDLALDAEYHYILTGTPMSNGQLHNIYSQFLFLYPDFNRGYHKSKIFGTWTNFSKKYCILNQWWQPRAYKNISELQDVIDEHSYRVKKEDCLDLPEKLPDKVFKIENKNKKIYKEMLKESTVMEYEILADNSLTKLAKLRQISSGFIHNGDETIPLKNEKIKELKTFCGDFDKKLVIFASYKQSMRDIGEMLDEIGKTYVYLNGDQPDKNIWQKFQDDPKIDVIICQYQSANAGINLHSADTMLFYEPPLSSNLLEQSRDRIHRIGQHHPCTYIFFLTEGTVEEKIYQRLLDYNDFTEKVFTEYVESYVRSYAK
ncbi:MAG: DEAD/DEAH box helicase [archaeon]